MKSNYPISVNGQQCVGPCYFSGTKIIHPITLDEISGVHQNFCPVNNFIYINPQTGKQTIASYDKCYIPTAKETIIDEGLREYLMSPLFKFSSDYFIKIYYKIFSLDDLLKWLENNPNDPFKTKERVFNNGMIVYGSQINIIDHRLAKFVDDIMTINLPKIYKGIKTYIKITNDKIQLVYKPKTIIDVTHTKEEIALIRNYIKQQFLGMDNVHNFMTKFIRYYKDVLKEKDLSNKLVDHMIDYIIKKIEASFDSINEK